MDWTFWVGGIVIVGLLVVTQVFLHESRWTRRPRPEEPEAAESAEPEEPKREDPGTSGTPGPGREA
jgi:hypothetical protein